MGSRSKKKLRHRRPEPELTPDEQRVALFFAIFEGEASPDSDPVQLLAFLRAVPKEEAAADENAVQALVVLLNEWKAAREIDLRAVLQTFCGWSLERTMTALKGTAAKLGFTLPM